MANEKIAMKRKLFYGWWIVLATSVISACCAGIAHYGLTAFFDPIVREFGWSRATTSLAFAFQRLEGGISGPIVGLLTDRFGPRKPMFIGVAILGGGLIWMSRLDSLAMFFLAILLVSIGFSGSATPGTVAVAQWFARRRGRAIGLMSAGVGLSGTLLPLLVWLIGQYGWRLALVLVGAGVWIVCLPLAAVVRHRPEDYGCLPDGDAPPVGERQSSLASPLAAKTAAGTVHDKADHGVREAMRTRAFWILSATAGLRNMTTAAVFILQIPYLLSIGYPAEAGALVVMLMTLSSILGRLSFGWLGDYIDKRYALAATFAFQFAGMLVLALARDPWHLALFVATFGPGYGGYMPLRPALQGDYFGRKAFGGIQGVSGGIAAVGGIIGPVFAGQMYDTLGDYRLAFLLLALASFPAVPAILVMQKPGLEKALA